MWFGVTSSASSGDGRRGQDVQAARVVASRTVRSSSGSRRAAGSRVTSARVWRGVRLRCVATPPNWRSRSIRTTWPGRRAAATTAMLTAIVVVPTPPFGLKHDDRPARPGHRQPVRGDDRREVLGALEPQEQRLDARLELARIERLGDDVVGAGLQEADPLLDVVRLADAQDRDGGHRGRVADLAAELGRGPRTGHHVQDDEMVVRGLAERLVRVGCGRDGVADRGQGRRDGLGVGRVGVEQEDGTGGHEHSEIAW